MPAGTGRRDFGRWNDGRLCIRVRGVRRAVRDPATYVRARSPEGAGADLPEVWGDRYPPTGLGLQLQDLKRLIWRRSDVGTDRPALPEDATREAQPLQGP